MHLGCPGGAEKQLGQWSTKRIRVTFQGWAAGLGPEGDWHVLRLNLQQQKLQILRWCDWLSPTVGLVWSRGPIVLFCCTCLQKEQIMLGRASDEY